MKDGIVKLYLNRRGMIGLSTKAVELLDLKGLSGKIGDDCYVGLIDNVAEGSIYLYGSTPTCEKPKRKVHTDKTNNTHFITIKTSMMSRFFEDIQEENYTSMALEEEPYIIDGIECYKIISKEEAKNLVD